MRAIQFVLITLFLLWNNLAAADEGWQQNTQLLPQYCKDRAKGSQSPEFNKWRGTFGEVAVHIHHYCDGLYAEQKARVSTNPQERNRWLENVIHEMLYVGKHCGAGCVLFPELHCRLGWALGESGQVAEAIKQFQLVIRTQPKYPPAYAKLSDLYVKIKMPDEAKKVLEAGLKARPGTPMLQRRLEKI
jgi:tetratricopeptide (TPR) repeat protein